MEPPRSDPVGEYWASFIRAGSAPAHAATARYQAWSFGNTPDMADRLGELVRRGAKTATATLVWSLEAANEPYPVVREYSIILDGHGLPMCIIQTTALSVVPFDEVDEEHAYLEGEGDRSLRYWRKAHWSYFGEECRRMGSRPKAQMPILCERFVLVHK